MMKAESMMSKRLVTMKNITLTFFCSFEDLNCAGASS